MGASRRRVEDNRFIRGRGNYVDDIVLPGMLHMEILRSPLAHARIKLDRRQQGLGDPRRPARAHRRDDGRPATWPGCRRCRYDTQAVLATDKVRFQGQEVACVIADDPYIAKDACEAIVVDYEPLPVIVNPTQALAEGAPLIRDDKENQHDNVIYDWEVGDKDGTDRAFAQADLVSKLELHYPRSHPSPIECCGSIADFNRSTVEADRLHDHPGAAHHPRRGRPGGRAARAHDPDRLPRPRRRVRQQGAGLPRLRRRRSWPRSSLERPVKWIEDRTGNLISTGFARDIYLEGELALRKDGRILGVRMHTDADHGAFFSDAQPSKFKIGLMHSAFACYDIPAAHLTARGVYTNKAPGGVAYRCSFRVTEAMFFQERMVQAAADDLGMDQAEFRRVNFVRDDDFPHRTPFGFLTDSGQYGKCLDVGLEAIGYEDFLQAAGGGQGQRGRLLGIGISTMTEPLGAGNSREYDILGIKMFDSAELRVHMTGKAILRTGAKTQGQGHETTWAQIVAHELGIPAEDIARRGGRHRHRAVRDGHLRLPQHAGGRCRGRDGVPQDPGQGPQARRPPARGVRGGRRVGAGPLLRAQPPRPGRHHPGVRDGGVHQHARRHGARPREQRLLRPAQPDLAVRLLHRAPSRSTPRPACGTCSTSSRSTTAACGSTR